MFCKKCGFEISKEDKFCSKCGAAISEPKIKSKMDTQNPVLITRPVFVPTLVILSFLPIQMFITIFAALFVGGMVNEGIAYYEVGIPQNYAPAFLGAITFIVFSFVAYYWKKKTYDKTEYKFFADRLEYMEGYLNIENKTIKYQNITEANLRKGILQKSYGLGTIILSTPATGFHRGHSRSGIKVLDIGNVEIVYRKILELISAHD